MVWHRDEEKGFSVYNMTVEDDHDYLAGTLAGGVWVHKDVVFQIYGCLFLPLHTRERNTYIVDVRFGTIDGTNDELLKYFAGTDDLIKCNLTEDAICKRINDLLNLIPGVIRWSILATEKRTIPIRGSKIDTDIRDDGTTILNDSHRQTPSQSVHFFRTLKGASYPGIAYAVADELYEQGFSLYSGVISEFPVNDAKRNMCILRGEPSNTNTDSGGPTSVHVITAAKAHIAKLHRATVRTNHGEDYPVKFDDPDADIKVDPDESENERDRRYKLDFGHFGSCYGGVKR